MEMDSPLTLIANPGSASRKYSLYVGERERAGLHLEWEHGKVICTLHQGNEQHVLRVGVDDISHSADKLTGILRNNNLLKNDEHINRIGLRVVAPSAYFLQDHVVDDEFVEHLEGLKSRAPIHIGATLEELHKLRSQFKEVTIVGVSDSAFHATKPDFAWNYGISLEDADRFEIKRFGYHGLSASAVVNSLRASGLLPQKLIVCHLGSGASVTAIENGESLDNTMGYSPLEGVIMSTRSGSIDATAVRALKDAYRLDDNSVEAYLNNHSGLLGLGGSADIRELLRREADGDNRSRLALATYVYSVQKAVGQMTASLRGVDGLVFTGTAGERSAAIRERITKSLNYLGIKLDETANQKYDSADKIKNIGAKNSKPICVVPTGEATEIVRHTLKF